MQLGLYIHIPFCKSKCPYCDFYSLPIEPKEDLYLQALYREIEIWADFFEKNYSPLKISFKTLYVGGGTPSLMSPLFYEKLIQKISKHFDCFFEELTLEANPESLTLDKAKGYRAIGFNRISLGIQTFQPKGLKFLKRGHNVEDSFKAIENIVKANFENFSLDYIYGWLGQGVKSLKKDLERALEINPPHLSFYELTLYPKTPFYEKYTLKANFLREDRLIQLSKIIRDTLQSSGYRHYEISNFSKKGFECKHNLGYWKVEPYLGIGPGAVSRIGNLRFQNIEDLEVYYQALLKKNKPAYLILENLDNKEIVKEKIFMGLRMSEGVNLLELRAFGYEIKREALFYLKKKKLIDFDEKSLFLSEKGSFLHNQVVKFLWEHLERKK